MKTITTRFFFLAILCLTGCKKNDVTFTANFEGKSSETKWALNQLNTYLPSDWTSYGYLTFDLRSSTTQKFDLKVYDSVGIRRVSILPFQGVWVRASLPLVHFQKRNTKGMDMAAIGKTARAGYWIGFTNAVGSIGNVDSIGVSMRLPIGMPTLEIRNVQLTMNPMDTVYGPLPLIDEFGQWTPSDWEGKADSITELQAAWTYEEKALTSGDPELSIYGGFKSTKVKGTGFFRVEKINGIWWFVDPEGYLFYSTGSTGIGPRSEFARVKGREYIFKSLPPSEVLSAGTQAANQVSGRSNTANYSFYSWNLYRRFGSDWYPKWMDMAVRRMENWGLNTIANWSDPNLGEIHRKAYVSTLRGWGIETGLMGMPDVYDPTWVKMVDEAAKRQCEPKMKDPWLLGYFIGNEPPWPHREAELINVILSGEATPMQSELKKYLEAGDTPERRKAFVYETYDKFITTINNAIKRHDPNHLNLGLRFGGSAPDEIVKASKGFDVFSFNHYGYSVNPDMINRISELTGLPMIIGEFHFGVPGRGLAPGLAQTVNQAERAAAYSYYVENAAANPSIIGTHWFQWMDQPATGRNDGENYNIGFVDVTDRPYPELIKASKETFRRIAEIHSGKTAPVDRKAIVQ